MSLMDRDRAALPIGLRERVMAASLLAREAGHPVPSVPAISGTEAFGRAADAFYGLLTTLDEQDWARPALRGLDVQGLTCREVARAMGIPEGTAKSRLRLAMAKLETVLDRQLLEST